MVNEKRLIDAKFAQHIANTELSSDEAGTVQWVLSHTPTETAVEPVRSSGYWIHDINNLYGCSECGGRETMSHRQFKPYCPNCGAIMNRRIPENAKPQ